MEPKTKSTGTFNPELSGLHLSEVEDLLNGPGDEEEIVNEQEQNEIVNEEEENQTTNKE